MLGTSIILAFASLTSKAWGQVITYTDLGQTVSGVATAANYTGSLRPQIHYSPPQGFMNDPNGMFVDANGTWHLYYQCRY
jgi:sucrose-6-phosphate hydrolase SacC (GH32 family)